ncbi:hypothetical protein I7I48_07244 [Histoplasma ohiense]|nr:hypothetical protein I7I48_07244 [Histoplasma ohiense (nom. inval.)]
MHRRRECEISLLQIVRSGDNCQIFLLFDFRMPRLELIPSMLNGCLGSKTLLQEVDERVKGLSVSRTS